MSVKNQIKALSRFSRLADYGKNKIHCDDARIAINRVGNYLEVDTKRLDIFSNTNRAIPEWEPDIYLTAYPKLTKLSIDIETDGGVEITNCNNYKDFPIADYSLKMIGVRNEEGKNKCIQDTEENMLKRFLAVLNAYKPHLLLGYNHVKFDLPFLIAKFEQYGLKHPFYISDKWSTFRTAQHFGKPTTFHAVYCSWGYGANKIQSHIIDVYHQVLSFDFVARKLTSYSLKQVPLQLGLRKDARLDLGFEGLLDCYAREDWATVQEYLEYDLEDTELIADFLLPAVYYQSLFCTEFSLQALATMGNGTKWNSILKDQYNGVADRDENSITLFTTKKKISYSDSYLEYWSREIEIVEYTAHKEIDVETEHSYKIFASIKRQFKGGKTGAFAGWYQFVSKIDVSSLYPAIQLKYGICSEKDPNMISLGILLYCRTVRIGFKTLKNLVEDKITGDVVSVLKANKKGVYKCFDFCLRIGYAKAGIDALRAAFTAVIDSSVAPGDYASEVVKMGKGFFKNEGSIKIFVNSGFGFLAAMGLPFNDMEAAALIPAYGRLILDFMVNYIKAQGGIICGLDTDGVYYSTSSLERNAEIYRGLQAALPQGIEIEKELDAEALFIPPVVSLNDFNRNYKVTSGHAKKLWFKVWSEEDEEKDISPENPELIEQSYQWVCQEYGDRKLTYEVFLAAAEKYDFVFPKTEGLRKNYVIFNLDGTVKAYGRYKKRDQTVLAKTFQIEYLKRYKTSVESAEKYYRETLELIGSGGYPIPDLSITKKIPKGSKELLSVGEIGGVVTYYHGVNGYVTEGDYDIAHYISVVQDLYSEIATVLKIAEKKVHIPIAV